MALMAKEKERGTMKDRCIHTPIFQRDACKQHMLLLVKVNQHLVGLKPTVARPLSEYLHHQSTLHYAGIYKLRIIFVAPVGTCTLIWYLTQAPCKSMHSWYTYTKLYLLYQIRICILNGQQVTYDVCKHIYSMYSCTCVCRLGYSFST